MRDIHIALQFGNIKHFNEGLSEFSRQLALQYATQARQLKEERRWHLHFILPKQWHGLFGNDVSYHELTDRMRWRHQFDVPLDMWHGLHQHMRYRPPVNCRHNVITVHDLNHVYAKKGLSLRWQNLRLARHLRRAHQLVAISKHVVQDIQHHIPWAPPVSVIYNGVADLSHTSKQKPTSCFPADYLLHISRMSLSKNVASLIGMASIWPERSLVLVGPDSVEVQKHKAHVAQLGLTNVHFLTDVTEHQKAWLLANCTAFLFPSLQEGFGLPPIEAMYFGKPVIVAHRTSLPEICGEQAEYWQDFSPNSMRNAVENRIQAFQQNPLLSLQVQTRARQYSWTRAAKSYLSLYQDAI